MDCLAKITVRRTASKEAKNKKVAVAREKNTQYKGIVVETKMQSDQNQNQKQQSNVVVDVLVFVFVVTVVVLAVVVVGTNSLQLAPPAILVKNWPFQSLP